MGLTSSVPNSILQPGVCTSTTRPAAGKICSMCKEYKSLDLYYSDLRGKFGKCARCKKCQCSATLASRKKNPEASIKSNKKYREANRVKRNLANKKWMKENRQHRIAYKAKYRKENAEYISNYMKEWYKRNPHKYSELSSRRRAREKCADVREVTNKDWNRCLARHNYCCFYCGTGGDMTMDHIIPISRNGRHSIGNIIPACMSCNSSKWTKTIVEWRRDNGFN